MNFRVNLYFPDLGTSLNYLYIDGRTSYIWKMHKYYTPFSIDEILDHRLVMMYDLKGPKKINVAEREICGCDLLLTELSKQL